MVQAGGVYWPDEGLFRMLVNYLFDNDDAIFAHNPLDEMRRLTLLGFCFKHGFLEEYNGSEGMALLYQYRDRLEAAADATMLGQNVPTKFSAPVGEADSLVQPKAVPQRKGRSGGKGNPVGKRREAAVAAGPEGPDEPGWRVSRRSGSGYSTDAAITASPPSTIRTNEVDDKDDNASSTGKKDKNTETGTETTVTLQPDTVKRDDQSMFHDVNTDKTPDVDNKTTGRTDETGTAGHINPHAFEGFAG
jgi:hypothetical protein